MKPISTTTEPVFDQALTIKIRDWLVKSIVTNDLDNIVEAMEAAAKGGPALQKHLSDRFGEVYEAAAEERQDDLDALFLARVVMHHTFEVCDWAAIAAAIEPCTEVHYDLDYWGGNYSRLDYERVCVPRRLVEEAGVERAFTVVTGGHDPAHIIFYESDGTWLPNGERVESE